MAIIEANGRELYYEIRGRGPSLLLIAGGGLDAGTFDSFADLLAPDFSVVTYDRSTSIEEQAEDAAGLLWALGLGPAAVVANSLGALIALELMLRQPELVRRVSLLDSGPVDSAVPDRRQRMPMPEETRAALAHGGVEGRRAGYEALLRFLGIWDSLDAAARRRTLANADVFFDLETSLLSSYRPDEALMRANRVPIQVAAGAQTAPVMREMAEWLAERLGVSVVQLPGGHLGYLEHPAEVVAAIRPFLGEISSSTRE